MADILWPCPWWKSITQHLVSSMLNHEGFAGLILKLFNFPPLSSEDSVELKTRVLQRIYSHDTCDVVW